MAEVGRLALWLALLASAAAVPVGLATARSRGETAAGRATRRSDGAGRSVGEPGPASATGRTFGEPGSSATGRPVGAAAQWVLGLAVVAAGVAVGALAWALVTNDFSLTYVADFSRRDASAPYRLASLWGGMAGSLLWFTTLVGAAGWWAARRAHDHRTRGRMVAVTGGLLASFCGLVLVFADPFRRLDVPALDGGGLTPILEHPAMLYHPPLLYLGLATLTGPFALTVARLAGARSVPGDDRSEPPDPAEWADRAAGADREEWAGTVRRWLMVPWILLAIGMLAGAHWAYVELGWGGYWAWDPVENTALLPWLAVTLALHAHQLRRPRHDGIGPHPGRNGGEPIGGDMAQGRVDVGFAALVCVGFLLALVGAMLTRSGAVSSVHAFAESRAIGRALGVLVAVVTIGVALLLGRTSSRLRSARITGDPKVGARSRAGIDADANGSIDAPAASSVRTGADAPAGDARTSTPALRPRPRLLDWLLVGHLAVVGAVLGVAFAGTVAPLVTDLRGGDGIAIEGRYFASFAGPLASVGLALVTLVPVARRLGRRADPWPSSSASDGTADLAPVGTAPAPATATLRWSLWLPRLRWLSRSTESATTARVTERSGQPSPGCEQPESRRDRAWRRPPRERTDHTIGAIRREVWAVSAPDASRSATRPGPDGRVPGSPQDGSAVAAQTPTAGHEPVTHGRRRTPAWHEAMPVLIGVGLGVGLLVVAAGDVDLPRMVLAGAAGGALASAAAAAAGRALRRDGPLGPDVAHAGIGLLLLGVAGTATGVTETVPVQPGDRVEVLGETVEYIGVTVQDRTATISDRSASEGAADQDTGTTGTTGTDGRDSGEDARGASASGSGTAGTGGASAGTDGNAAVVADVRTEGRALTPSLVAYPARGVLLAETSLVSTPLRDVQVALRDASDDGSAVLQIGVHPLQVLVWWGGLLIVAAGLVTAWEHRRATTARRERALPSRPVGRRSTVEPPVHSVG